MTENIIYVDAGYRMESGGHIAWFNETTGQPFHTKLDCADSFRCELQAVFRALEDHKEALEIAILLDNRTVADQLNRKAGINDDDIRDLCFKIWNLARGKKVRFLWIERKQNKAGKMLGS